MTHVLEQSEMQIEELTLGRGLTGLLERIRHALVRS